MKIKNLKINKKILSILVGVGLTLIPVTGLAIEGQGDYIKTDSRVNFRISNDLNSDAIGSIRGDTELYRIYSCDNNFDLVEYDHKLGFVCSDYTYDVSDETSGIKFENYYTTLYCMESTELTLKMSDDSRVLESIQEGQSVETIAKASNGYLVVKFNGKLGFVKEDKFTEDIIVYSEPKPVQLDFDYYSTEDVRLRSGPSTKYDKIDLVPGGTKLEFLGLEDGWYHIIYNGKEGYVSGDYVSQKYNITNVVKLVTTTDWVNFREGPGKDYKRISELPSNIPLQILSEENGFYMVSYQGKIGYISKDYTLDLTEQVSVYFPEVSNINIMKVCIANKDMPIVNSPNDDNYQIGSLNRYECVHVIQDFGDYSFVLAGNKMGYVKKSDLLELHGNFICIDLGTQRSTLYVNDNEIAISTAIISGKDGSITPVGKYTISKIKRDSRMSGPGYDVYVGTAIYFNGGIAEHGSDDFRTYSEFKRDTNYHKKHGSHGCANGLQEQVEFKAGFLNKGDTVVTYERSR